MTAPRINPSTIGVLLIDVQPLFLDTALPPGTQERESLLIRLEHFLMLADWMDLPTIATFEKPVSENGELPDRPEPVFPAQGRRFVKNFFGSTSEPTIREGIEQLSVRQLAVAGAETDVCVLQTALGLLDAGHEVFLLEDCLFTTSYQSEPGPALRRMYAAGAVPCTLKTMAYELTRCVTNVPWYSKGWTMGSHPEAKLFPKGFVVPEKWPAWESSL